MHEVRVLRIQSLPESHKLATSPQHRSLWGFFHIQETVTGGGDYTVAGQAGLAHFGDH